MFKKVIVLGKKTVKEIVPKLPKLINERSPLVTLQSSPTVNKSLSPPSLTAIILAGGKSSRMGRDKALICIEGIPLLQRTCTVAQKCTKGVYVVTPWLAKYRHILPQGCKLIKEVPWRGKIHHGPLVGFAQGLLQVKTPWVLLLACDLPHLQPEQILEWTEYLNSASQDHIAALPRHDRGWEPLCGFYRRSCLSQLNQYIAGGGRSFQGWLAQHEVQELPLCDPQLLFNCNTPDDLAQVKDKEKRYK